MAELVEEDAGGEDEEAQPDGALRCAQGEQSQPLQPPHDPLLDGEDEEQQNRQGEHGRPEIRHTPPWRAGRPAPLSCVLHAALACVRL